MIFGSGVHLIEKWCRWFAVGECLSFHSSVAEDSVLLGCDIVSLKSWSLPCGRI